MALKNPNVYPQFHVYLWEEKQKPDGEWEADRRRLDAFDNELEAYALYKRTSIGDNVVEVDLEKETYDDCFPVRHKDTSGEYIY